MISNGGVSAREKMCSLRRLDLDLAGRQLGVDVVAARDDAAGDGDAELGAQLAGERVRLGVDVGTEDHLRDAGAIAKIDEDAAAVIAARGHPAHEDDVLVADVGGAQLRHSEWVRLRSTRNCAEPALRTCARNITQLAIRSTRA